VSIRRVKAFLYLIIKILHVYVDVAYWKHDNIRFLLGGLDDHGSSMGQIVSFVRPNSSQLYQSEGKGSESGHRLSGPRCWYLLVKILFG
jgi:hypothetical protein